MDGFPLYRAVVFDLFDTLTLPHDDTAFTPTVVVMGDVIGGAQAVTPGRGQRCGSNKGGSSHGTRQRDGRSG